MYSYMLGSNQTLFDTWYPHFQVFSQATKVDASKVPMESNHGGTIRIKCDHDRKNVGR